MQDVAPNARIFGSSIEWCYEYQYLLNETFLGEEIAVFLLETLANRVRNFPKYYDCLMRQVDEETEHFQLYGQLLGESTPRPHSGFNSEFVAYVGSLSTATEIAFCVQTVFETLSLGAIGWRIRGETLHKAETVLDRKIYREEYAHTVLTHQFLNGLKREDGLINKDLFRNHLRNVCAIFSRSYSAANLSDTIFRQFGVVVAADVIHTSPGYASFRWRNAVLGQNAYRKYCQAYEENYA